MTRVDMQGRLQNFFNNSVYYTTDDLNASIQDGLDEVAAFSGCVFNSAVLPFINNKTYYDMLTLLPDYIGVIAIFNSTIRRWLLPTSIRKLDQDRIDWETALGVPYYFVPVTHRYVAIYKKPGTVNYGNMYVFYRASAPLLCDSDTIPIPDDHIQALENYSRTDLWEQNQEWGKAGQELGSYRNTLDLLKTWMNRRNSERTMSLR